MVALCDLLLLKATIFGTFWVIFPDLGTSNAKDFIFGT